MASITLSPVAGWAVGQTVTVYPASGDGGQSSTVAVTTATVASDRTTQITGLADNGFYIAVNGANSVRFSTKLDAATRVTDTKINMLAEGVPTDGTTDCSAAIEAVKAKYTSGGRMVFPPGVFKMLSPLDLTAQPWSIEGSGVFTTTLWCGGVDANNAMIVMGADSRIANLSLVGVTQVTIGNVGSAPLKRGVVLRDRAAAENVRVEAFGVGVVIDGNHQSLTRVKVTACKRNIAWAQGLAGYSTAVAASFTHGNQTLVACDFTGAGETSCYVAGDSKIDASDIIGTHFGFAPHGILFAAANGQQMALGGGTVMHGASFENCGLNYIEDLGWNTANRRMSKGLRWISPRTGGIDPTYDPLGAGGNEMVKLGICQDWTIEGVVGDSSNTSFGTQGWSNTLSCGFRFEQCNGFFFRQADTLWTASGAQAKPMFRWEGGVLDWSDVYFTILNGGYLCSALKNGSGGTLTNEFLVSGVTPGSPTGTNGVKHHDGTGAAIGRVIAGGPLTTGLIVPIAFEGRLNSPPTADATIAIGSSLAPTSTGSVKKAAAGDQIIGTAFATPSGGSVSASFRGPWVARF